MLLPVRTCCLKYFEFLRCYDTISVMCIFVYAQRSAHSVLCTCDYTCVVDLFNWYIMQIVMVWIARLHSQRRTHISNAQVIKSKNEQNCSLIHMMKYNPLDGNCICFVLTFFVHTCMRMLAAWIAFHVCLSHFWSPSSSPSPAVHVCMNMYWTCWVDGNDGYVIISQQLHLMFGFYVPTIGSSNASNNNNVFNQIIWSSDHTTP